MSQREEDEESSGERRSRRHRRPRRQEVEARVETSETISEPATADERGSDEPAPAASPEWDSTEGAGATTVAVSGDTDAASTGATWTGEAAERPGAEPRSLKVDNLPNQTMRRPQGPPSKRDRTI